MHLDKHLTPNAFWTTHYNSCEYCQYDIKQVRACILVSVKISFGACFGVKSKLGNLQFSMFQPCLGVKVFFSFLGIFELLMKLMHFYVNLLCWWNFFIFFFGFGF